MQTIRKTILTVAFLISSLFLFDSLADSPLDAPPPPPGGGHGGGGNTQGAPISGGIQILMVLGIGYGTYRICQSSRELKKSDQVAPLAVEQGER